MASSYSTDLKLELQVTGENAGTWGDITNTNLVLLQQAIAGYQTVSIAGGAQTTALAMTNATLSNARNAVIELTGTITGNQVVTVPDGIEKIWTIYNNTTGAFTVQFKTVSGTGYTFATTDKTTRIFYSDGTNIVNPGFVNTTGTDTLTNKTLTSPTLTTPVIATTGFIADTNGNEQLRFVTTASATNEVTVTNAAAGNNPNLSATGGDTNVGINLTPKGTGRVTVNGNGKIFGVAEGVTITTTFQTTLNYDTDTQAVFFANVAASANWTVNLRGSSTNALNSALAVNESLTVALLAKNNNTTYYNNVIQVDGTTVTAIWQGGTAPTTGNASSTDVYTYTAIKTAASTYTVLASQTQFK